MPKQTFRLRNYSILNILFSFSSFMLALFGLLVMFPPVTSDPQVSATIDYDTYGLSIITSSSINLELNPTSDGTVAIAKDTVTAITASPNGYKLYVSTNSSSDNNIYLNGTTPTTIEDLDHTTTIKSTTGTFNAPSVLTLDNNNNTYATWGYAVAELNNFDSTYSTTNPSTSSKFASLPTKGNEQLIKEYIGAAAYDTTDIYYGVKANTNLAAGNYTTEILYTTMTDVSDNTILNGEATIIPNILEEGYDTTVATITTSLTTTRDLGDISVSFIDEIDYTAFVCRDIQVVDEYPITLTCTIPADLAVGNYNVTINFANLGKNYGILDGLAITHPKTPKAILGANGNLNFVYDNNTYTVGTAYEDNLEETEIMAVYDVPENASSYTDVAWAAQCPSADLGDDVNPTCGDVYSNIITVNFTDSFYDFHPISTAYWFYGNEYLSAITDTSNLNTSSVTNMAYMFSYTGYLEEDTFALDLSSWDTRLVINMAYMFYYTGYSATTFTLGIDNWNTSSVTDMRSMFSYAGYSADTFTLDLSNWNTSSVTNMHGMFYKTGYSVATFILDLGNWDTSSATDMGYMFACAGYSATTWSLGDINTHAISAANSPTGEAYTAWNTSSVIDMSYMFSCAGFSATNFTLNLSNWNTSLVTNMRNMFEDAGYSATTWSLGDINTHAISAANSPTGEAYTAWNTSLVTNMYRMFYLVGHSATTFTLNLSNWNTSSVTNMSGMLWSAGFSAPTWSIGNINTHAISAANSPTGEAYIAWNTSKVTDMSYMFRYTGYYATTFVLDLSNWDTSSVTNMSNMFYNTGRTATWSLDLSVWNVNKVTSHADFNTGITSKIIPPVWVH